MKTAFQLMTGIENVFSTYINRKNRRFRKTVSYFVSYGRKKLYFFYSQSFRFIIPQLIKKRKNYFFTVLALVRHAGPNLSSCFSSSSAWNATTAFSVFAPKLPSMLSLYTPYHFRNIYKYFTWVPVSLRPRYPFAGNVGNAPE